MLTRRVFNKIGTIAVGSLILNKYSEHLAAISEKYRDWVEDCGSFYIVRIPHGKIMRGETFDKPTIFQFGQCSQLVDSRVNGYGNVYGTRNNAILGCEFDLSTTLTELPREAMIIGSANRMLIKDFYAILNSHVNAIQTGEPK